MKLGIVIFVNGTSSSGKSTIARAIQNAAHTPYVHFSVDAFLLMLPTRYVEGESPPDAASACSNVIRGFHSCIATMARKGNDIVVDHVLQFPILLEDCRKELQGLTVYFVGIHCPLEELQKRELARGDRDKGLAENQFQLVHSHGEYDLELNTSSLSGPECAKQILNFIDDQPTPSVFNQGVS